MGYSASVYIKDTNGNYSVPIYNEYRTTKLLKAGVVAKLLRGVSVYEKKRHRWCEHKTGKIKKEQLQAFYFGCERNQ